MLAEIFGPDIFIVGLVVLVGLGIPIWAIVDIAGRPDTAFSSAGSSKTTWLLQILIFTLLCGVVGFVLAVYYLVVVRPKVVAAT